MLRRGGELLYADQYTADHLSVPVCAKVKAQIVNSGLLFETKSRPKTVKACLGRRVSNSGLTFSV